MPRSVRSLTIVSHVVHYAHAGRVYAYGPYAREIDVWAGLFPRITIAAPVREAPPAGDCLPLQAEGVRLVSQPETDGTTIWRRTWQLLQVPRIALSLARAMRQSDAVHVRCPGNLGLLGVLVAPMVARRIVAKYAGQWNGYPSEAWTVRLQRRLLSSSWWHGPTTVYGRWPRQPEHVVPFFTSLMSTEQLTRAREVAARRARASELRVIYVGRLSKSKNVDHLLRAVAALRAEGKRLRVTLVGEGEEAAHLRQLSGQLELEGAVEWTGGLPHEQVLALYEEHDVLVLASETEGWPKAIAEGMAYGLVCIGSDRGLVPEMLAQGRGLIVRPGDTISLIDTLRPVCAAPERFDEMRQRAAAWAAAYSIENLGEAIRSLLSRAWDVSIEPGGSSSLASEHCA